MTVKHECSGRVADRELRGMIYSCQRPATVERNGKWYCWQHDPIRVEADKKKRRARWNAKHDRETAKRERRARNAKLAALVTPELAGLLGDIVSGEVLDYDRMQREPARALAARIREALEEANSVKSS